MVLLANNGVLPLDPAGLKRVAVIGQSAAVARTQGGGSATVIPRHTVSPLAGLRAALPGAEVVYRPGAVVDAGVAPLPPDRLTHPTTGKPGVRVEFLDSEGRQLFAEHRYSTALVWFGGEAPVAEAARLVLETVYTPDSDGLGHVGFAGQAAGRILADGVPVVADHPVSAIDDLGAAFLNPSSATAAVAFTAARPVTLRAEFDLKESTAATGTLSLTLGLAPDNSDPDGLLAEAAAAVAQSDVAVVVVGTTPATESEGRDRTSLALPGRQDDLVRAVAATGTPTIVVVNSGAPVELPWADDVAAVLAGFFGGQEFGSALAGVLTGQSEPGGRLPMTWPGSLADVPVANTTPEDGELSYREGIHVGYRAWLKAGAQPAYPFGHGLSYTTWAWDSALWEDGRITVGLRNTGSRPGKQIVQVYAERADSVVDRPARWLVGAAVVRAEAGAVVTARVNLPRRAFQYWENGWMTEPGVYRLMIGPSLADLPLSLTVDWV
jgi:beta-glucosidase